MAEESIGHDGGGFGDGDTGGFEGGDFASGSAFSAGDDGSCVAHAASWRSGSAGDEGGDGFFAMGGDPRGGFFFGFASDFADHDDGFGFGIVVEHFQDIGVIGAVDGVATDSDASALAEATSGQLPDGFVGERAAPRDDADVAFFVDVAWSDADAAAAVRFVACAWGNDAWAVGADQAGGSALHGVFDADHVIDGDAFGDGDGEIEAGVDAFEDGVGGEGWRDKDGADRGAGFAGSFGDGVEDGDAMGAVFEDLATFSWGDAGDELSAVVEGEASVAGAEVTGDALNEDSGGRRDENSHE